MVRTRAFVRFIALTVVFASAMTALASRARGQGCAPPPSGMLGWWPGDGNTLDLVGGNGGMLMGGAAYAAGEVAQAFALDGTGDYVKVPKASALDPGGQVTIALWMRGDPANPMQGCCQGVVTTDFYAVEIGGGSMAGVNFYISTDAGSSFSGTANANGTGAVLSAGAWHHVAGTYDGAQLQLYVDGAPWGNPQPHSGAISPMLESSFPAIGSEDGRTTCPFCIGNRYFKGLLDEVQIFDRALSAGEIQAIFAAGSAGLCKQPYDNLSVGSAIGYPGGTVEVPIYIRDASGSPLGVDRPAGSKIQSISLKVTYTAAEAVTDITVARSGILAGLTPIFESKPKEGNSIRYLVGFDEATNPIPFTLDAAEPGDEVARLTLTLASTASLGSTVSLVLEPADAELTNQAGSLREAPSLGTLALGDGSVQVKLTRASDLVATAQSASSISLLWTDPNTGETGFRIERSTDGSTWTPVTTVGPDVTTYLDAGLAATTLFYYRVVAFSGSGDTPASNVAAATTFASVAARVCMTRFLTMYSKPGSVSVTHGPIDWVAAWPSNALDEYAEVYFQKLDAATGAPLGSPVQITDTDLASNRPTIVWNGTDYGMLWAGSGWSTVGSWLSQPFFALLDANGSKVRGDMQVMPPGVDAGVLGVNGVRFPLVWDGTGWGVFAVDPLRAPGDWMFVRLDADGNRVVGPVYIHSTPEQEADLSAAWNGSQYGLAWAEYGIDTTRVLFQRMQQDGTLLDAPLELASKPVNVSLWGASIVWQGSAWAVAWSVADAADPSTDDSERVYVRRLDAAGVPLGPEVRLSDLVDPEQPPDQSWPVYDMYPRMVARSDGTLSVFTQSYMGPNFNYFEVGHLAADASGNKVGTRTVVSAKDQRNSMDFCPASDGTNALVAYTDSHLGRPEPADAVVSPAGTVLAGPTDITTDHSPAGAAVQRIVTIGEGFGLVWTDSGTGTNLLQAQIRDGSGAVTAEKHPLSARSVSGAVGAVGVGDAFAVAWREGTSPAIYFCRFDAAGNPLIVEANVSSLGVGGSNPVVDFSGAAYGVAWFNAQTVRLQNVLADGSLTGTQASLTAGGGPQALQIKWIGTGWALVWRSNFTGTLYFAVVGADGTVVVAPTVLTGSTVMANTPSIAWTGDGIGLAWVDSRGGVFPDVYLTVLNRDGSKRFADKAVITTPDWEAGVFLHWTGSRFGLVYSATSKGMCEIHVLADGTVENGETYLNPAPAAMIGASNGATTALATGTYFHTTACNADTTPPPCPPAAATFDGTAVHLSWSAVADAETGIFCYNVFRDCGFLAELFPARTSFTDTGLVANHVHTYEVRAVDGAFNASTGCTVFRFGTTCGDVNADGPTNVLDIFYLINNLFGGGPPPLGDGDVNGDGSTSVADIFYLINHLFAGGPPPVC